MKVLTIKQPFATLIAEEIKEYEFRTWKTKYRGEFLIHAGKSIDKKAKEDWKIEEYEGILLQNIDEYYKYLQNSNREKDKARIPLVEEYMKNRKR